MSDTADGPAGGLELRLRLPGETVPLDQVVIAVVSLVARVDVVDVNARLNLIEGDLSVIVTGPDRVPVRCGWPWPVDSAPRSVALSAGQMLIAAVPLVASRASAPLFAVPGAYVVDAAFDTGRGVIAAPAVRLVRTAPTDAARADALRDRDALQSLLAGGVLGDGRRAVEVLAASDDPATAAMADIALGRVVTDRGDAGALAVAAVLPPGATGADDRRDAARDGASAEVLTAFDGTPSSAG
ncbi:hypothetical protein QL996_15725 [Planococcus sp. APC 4015]|nr:hypothetical protein [Planococcus sp. APC 4015]